MPATYVPIPDCPPLAARGTVTFTCHPADLPQFATWLDAMGFIQIAPAHQTEYGRWWNLDHTALLVAWRSGSLLCQGKRPGQLAGLLRAQVRDLQATLFDLEEVRL
jgi:hypothetical protein